MTKGAQIKKYIIQNIINKKWLKNQKIPSEKQLIAKFSCSREPIRRFLLELSNANWIDSKQGIGHFVLSTSNYATISTKKLFQITHTKISPLSKEEKIITKSIQMKDVNNAKKYAKHYYKNGQIIMSSVCYANNDYLFLLKNKEIQEGIISSFIAHKIHLSFQKRNIIMTNFHNQYFEKFGYKDGCPIIITELQEQITLF